MEPALQQALADRLLAMADDELILGHRNSEWCGHAPILEEDIAFANIALDEIGHASVWYTMLAQLLGEDEDTYPDQQVFGRNSNAYRCVPMVALPIGDWAFSMTRQYLFDAYEAELLDTLAVSQYTPFCEAAAKFRKEEVYHLRHTGAWVRRLGLGTVESHRRMQRALNELAVPVDQLFTPLPGDIRLIDAGYFPDPAELRERWLARVSAHLTAAELELPETRPTSEDGRTAHNVHLTNLLNEMQKVARLDPDAEW